jgi:hypothetical protein
MSAIARAEELFSDRRWRLNNLYKIKDKSGFAIPFVMNEAQEELYANLHCLNVVLKARQMGFTTLLQLLLLDACLFNSNISAGVIAHNREDAEAFFSDKIKFAYENIDPEIRKVVSATQDSAHSLTFSNGSKIRVGTSLRSGTFQYLHVSEYGKICARYPDKAKEIRTGAFNAVQAGNFIAVESTAEGQGGDFYEMVMKAKRMAQEGRHLTAMDFKLHFFPWHLDKSYALSAADTAATSISADDDAYFDKLAAKHDVHLTPEQEAWYVKKREQQGAEMRREFPTTEDEAFEASIEGAFFSNEMARVRKEGRICQVPIEDLPVDTFWDLGLNDDMTIWFRQIVGLQHRYIGYYANNGEGFQHYAEKLSDIARDRGFVYGTHYMPHDANQRRLGREAKSARMLAQECGIKPIVVVPRIPLDRVGIAASRAYFPKVWIDEKHCVEGIWALDNHRREWDDDRGVWKDSYFHGKASHGYKAFETAAVALPAVDFDDDDARETAPERNPVSGY